MNYSFLTQKERDVETGLDYFGARYYASTQGRFSGIDPEPFKPADPQSFNRYSYVQSNPLKSIDPSGESLVINGEDAAYIVSELEKKTGYKLKRDEKTGVVTIDESVKRQTGKGISDKLANTLAAAIAPTAKVTDASGNSKDLAFTVTLNTVRDQDGTRTSVFFDRYATRSIDVNDFKVTNATAPELSAAILGHVLDEYTQAETTFKALGALNPTAQERASHTHGLFVESQILSDFTGQQEITRAQSGVGRVVRFNYTSVQYDILTKGDAGPAANAIERVTKKKTP